MHTGTPLGHTLVGAFIHALLSCAYLAIARLSCISTELNPVSAVELYALKAWSVRPWRPRPTAVALALCFLDLFTSLFSCCILQQMYCVSCNFLNNTGTCMRCGRALQLMPQIVLRGDSASKPVIVLPAPTQSASLAAVRVHSVYLWSVVSVVELSDDVIYCTLLM